MEENRARNDSKTSDPPTNQVGSIEVGVIIMGMSCVFVVACALIILQLRSVRRQRMRIQRSSTVSVIMNDDSPCLSSGPPSYEAVWGESV
ncbi:hypothetical protein QZH41_005731 [Actinostola sp. cb2023]|nr:hypothetical protein QZH41_005731 [Actinostola sp. cb2023]